MTDEFKTVQNKIYKTRISLQEQLYLSIFLIALNMFIFFHTPITESKVK